MALHSSTQSLVNDIDNKNVELNLLASSLSALEGKKLEDCDFYKKLPDEGKSIFYGLQHYQHYRNLTLTKLRSVLTSSEFGFVFLETPCLIFSSALMAIMYVITIQFKNGYDSVLEKKITDRQERIPTWIVSLRQQLPFLEILPMTKAVSYFKQHDYQSLSDTSLAPNGPGFSIYIDFRRVPPPNWVREIKVSRLLDDTVDVQSLIKSDPFNPAMIEVYKKEIEQISEFLLTNEQTSQHTDKNHISRTTTRLISPSPLPSTYKNMASLPPTKTQTNLGDLFRKMAEQKPLKRPASDIENNSQSGAGPSNTDTGNNEERPLKRQRIDDDTLPGMRSSLPTSGAVAVPPIPSKRSILSSIPKEKTPKPKKNKPSKKSLSNSTSGKKSETSSNPPPLAEEEPSNPVPAIPLKKKRKPRVKKDALPKQDEGDHNDPMDIAKTSEGIARSPMAKYLIPQANRPTSALTPLYPIPGALTRPDELAIFEAFKQWSTIDPKVKERVRSHQFYTFLNSHRNGPLPPFPLAYSYYLSKQMERMQSELCTVFGAPTKMVIEKLYEASKTARDKDFTNIRQVTEDQEELQCTLTKKKLTKEEAIRLDILFYDDTLTRKTTTTFIISKSKMTFLKTICAAFSFLYSSMKEMKKFDAVRDQVVARQSDILDTVISLLNYF